MERVNQELEQFLRLFINQRQDDWDNLLPFAEFQYNNHIHSTTQNTPFLLDTGWIPWMGFEPDQQCSHMESVNEFKEQMENVLKEAKAALVNQKTIWPSIMIREGPQPQIINPETELT